jgi:hypothetical protein
MVALTSLAFNAAIALAELVSPSVVYVVNLYLPCGDQDYTNISLDYRKNALLVLLPRALDLAAAPAVAL